MSASWTNGCEAYVGPVAPELGEHALPGGRRRRAVDLRRLGRPGCAGMQHQRRDRRRHGLGSRGTGGRPLDGHALHRQQVEQHASAWTARGARAARPTSPRRPRCPPARVRVPTPSPLDAAAGKVFVANSEQHARPSVSTSTCNQIDDDRLRHADADRLGRPSQLPDGAGRERVHPLRGEQQRHRGRVQRDAVDHHLRGDGHAPSGPASRRPWPSTPAPTASCTSPTAPTSRIEYFSADDVQRHHDHAGCSTAPATVAVGQRPGGADRRQRCRRPLRGQRRAAGEGSRSSA